MKLAGYGWPGAWMMVLAVIMAFTVVMPETLLAQREPVTTSGGEIKDEDAAHFRPKGGCRDGAKKERVSIGYGRPWLYKTRIIALEWDEGTTVDTVALNNELDNELDNISLTEEEQDLEAVLVIISKYEISKFRVRRFYKRRRIARTWRWTCENGEWVFSGRSDRQTTISAGTKTSGSFTRQKFTQQAFEAIVEEDIAGFEAALPSGVDVLEE